MTLRKALDKARAILGKAGVDDPSFDAMLLLCEAAGIKKAALLAASDEEIVGDKLKCFFDMVERRSLREPLQHILGTAGFMDFFVNVCASVLIPRPETETLVKVMIDNEPDPDISILDLGTGSGCIAIALSRAGYKNVTASDISPGALGVAKENALMLGQKIDFIEADLFSGIDKRFDAIVCNPPYIASEDIDTLMPEVRDFDPRIALDGGSEGLDFYKRIASECGPFLNPGGRLYLELGAGEQSAVEEILTHSGFDQRDIFVTKDLAGIERVLRAAAQAKYLQKEHDRKRKN